MAFRFRRSIRLAPGLRVNVSKRGASLSVGPRGATMNLSGRGTRSTVGLPGTGLSWSSLSSRGRRRAASRRPSQRQLEAMERRAQLAQKQEEAAKAVAQQEAKSKNLLNVWREAPDVPSDQEFHKLLDVRPFRPSKPEPDRPYESAIRDDLFAEHLEQATSEIGRSTWLTIGLSILCMFLVFFLVANFGGWGVLAGLVITGGSWLGYDAILKTKRRNLAHERSDHDFAARMAREMERHQKDLDEYCKRVAEEHQSWAQSERTRVAEAKLLIDGDPDTVGRVLSEALEELDFPFEALCRVGTNDGSHVYVLLDLPEIEDAIPETKTISTAKGDLKEKKRMREERAVDYAHLVCGLAFHVGRVVVAVAPTAKEVSVAGYTQRRQTKTGVERDDYVFEMIASRQALVGLPLRDISDPTESLRQLRPSRIDLRDNRELRRIDPPEWAAELSS
jgi:hypothetical protein